MKQAFKSARIVLANFCLPGLAVAASVGFNGPVAAQHQTAPIHFQAPSINDWQLSGPTPMQMQIGLPTQADPAKEIAAYSLIGGTLGLIIVGLRVKAHTDKRRKLS